MSPLTLEEDTLGQKHKHFNKIVRDALASDEKLEPTKIDCDGNDLDNLLNIDIASKHRNVEYIIEVLKCEDLLYVSRALKRCVWLVTDPQYAHIINPTHLHLKIFPHMTTKAINKLLLQVRLHLSEEKRVEDFYNYIKEHKPGDKLKWLEKCSLEFIDNVLKKESQIPLHLYIRICRRSITFIKYYSNITHADSTVFNKLLFLLNNHAKEFFDIWDATNFYSIPDINKKHTEIIMNKCPNRILDKFEKYARCVHPPTVAKYLKKKNENMKEFVLKYIKHDDLKYFFNDYENLQAFIKYIPNDERFQLIKQVFIDKNDATVCQDSIQMFCSEDVGFDCDSERTYQWYRFMPFNMAFAELKKLIRAESSPSVRCAIFNVLVITCHRNPQHLHTVLQYYYEKHVNEPFKFKVRFVNHVLAQIPVHQFEDNTWNILEPLFHSMEVYVESDNNVQTCLKSIMLRKVVHNQEIPEIIEKKFAFDTFKNVQTKLNEEQKSKVFTYLYNSLAKKLQEKVISDESQFHEIKKLLKKALNLLNDWNKNLKDYPIVLDSIKELIKNNKDDSKRQNLLSLYNENKSWRRHLFDESLLLCDSEEVYLNALKHAPQLLVRHRVELTKRQTTDPPRRLLQKLRIYYGDTLAQQFIEEYFAHLKDASGQNALIKGLFTLLPQKQVVDIAKKYAPDETKINWSDTDQIELSIRKNIAKNLYSCRPLVPLDVMLWYAKGDYLQFAVPSLNANLHNLSKERSREQVSKLLDAPVSLQKYGIHLAFNKLSSEELRPTFSKIWNTTKNSTIRAVLFTYIHSMLCKVKDPTEAKHVWELVSNSIDNLSSEENKIIYKKLGIVKNIHASVAPQFFMKSYVFLTSLPAKANCENIINKLMDYAPTVMESLTYEFVTNSLLANIKEEFCKKTCTRIDIVCAFMLHANTDEDLMRRYERILLPLMEGAFESWDTVADKEYLVRNNFTSLNKTLSWRFRNHVIKKREYVPVKLFTLIKDKVAGELSVQENYVLITYWKLAEVYAQVIDKHKSLLEIENDELSESDLDSYWLYDEVKKVLFEFHKKVSPELGPIFVQYLKEDVEKYFPSIYSLFAEAFTDIFHYFIFDDDCMKQNTMRYMLDSQEFIPSYLLVCKNIYKYSDDKATRLEISKMLSTHPSMEVQMHYKKVFWDVPEVDKEEE